jgi:hypothetical protein
MQQANVTPDWFERGIAIAFAVVAVMGSLIVILAVALYLSGTDGSAVPLP